MSINAFHKSLTISTDGTTTQNETTIAADSSATKFVNTASAEIQVLHSSTNVKYTKANMNDSEGGSVLQFESGDIIDGNFVRANLATGYKLMATLIPPKSEPFTISKCINDGVELTANHILPDKVLLSYSRGTGSTPGLEYVQDGKNIALDTDNIYFGQKDGANNMYKLFASKDMSSNSQLMMLTNSGQKALDGTANTLYASKYTASTSGSVLNNREIQFFQKHHFTLGCEIIYSSNNITPITGLVENTRYYVVDSKANPLTVLSASGTTITFSSNHDLLTNDTVLIELGSSTLGGLNENTIYYVTKIDLQTISLRTAKGGNVLQVILGGTDKPIIHPTRHNKKIKLSTKNFDKDDNSRNKIISVGSSAAGNDTITFSEDPGLIIGDFVTYIRNPNITTQDSSSKKNSALEFQTTYKVTSVINTKSITLSNADGSTLASPINDADSKFGNWFVKTMTISAGAMNNQISKYLVADDQFIHPHIGEASKVLNYQPSTLDYTCDSRNPPKDLTDRNDYYDIFPNASTAGIDGNNIVCQNDHLLTTGQIIQYKQGTAAIEPLQDNEFYKIVETSAPNKFTLTDMTGNVIGISGTTINGDKFRYGRRSIRAPTQSQEDAGIQGGWSVAFNGFYPINKKDESSGFSKILSFPRDNDSILFMNAEQKWGLDYTINFTLQNGIDGGKLGSYQLELGGGLEKSNNYNLEFETKIKTTNQLQEGTYNVQDTTTAFTVNKLAIFPNHETINASIETDGTPLDERISPFYQKGATIDDINQDNRNFKDGFIAKIDTAGKDMGSSARSWTVKNMSIKPKTTTGNDCEKVEVMQNGSSVSNNTIIYTQPHGFKAGTAVNYTKSKDGDSYQINLNEGTAANPIWYYVIPIEGTPVNCTGVNIDTNSITVDNHEFIKNQLVKYTKANSSVIGGLVDNYKYIIADVTSTKVTLKSITDGQLINLTNNTGRGTITPIVNTKKFKLANSYANAIANVPKPITIQSVGNAAGNVFTSEMKTSIYVKTDTPEYKMTSGGSVGNALQFAEPHGFEAGTLVTYIKKATSSLTLLENGKSYYVLPTNNANTMKLSTTLIRPSVLNITNGIAGDIFHRTIEKSQERFTNAGLDCREIIVSSVSNNIITTTSSHTCVTGTAIKYSKNAATSDIQSGGAALTDKVYYVISISSNTLQLTDSYSNAVNNVPITLLDGAGNNSSLYKTGSAIFAAKHMFKNSDELQYYTQTEYVSTSNISNNTIVLQSDHNLLTGTQIIYEKNDATGIIGLTDKSSYYIIRESSNSFKLATSAENALDGLVKTISGGSTGNKFTRMTVYAANTPINENENIITFESNHNFHKGDAITYTNNGGNTAFNSALENTNTYFVANVVSENQIMVSDTHAKAVSSNTCLTIQNTDTLTNEFLCASPHGFSDEDTVIYYKKDNLQYYSDGGISKLFIPGNTYYIKTVANKPNCFQISLTKGGTALILDEIKSDNRFTLKDTIKQFTSNNTPDVHKHLFKLSYHTVYAVEDPVSNTKLNFATTSEIANLKQPNIFLSGGNAFDKITSTSAGTILRKDKGTVEYFYLSADVDGWSTLQKSSIRNVKLAFEFMVTYTGSGVVNASGSDITRGNSKRDSFVLRQTDINIINSDMVINFFPVEGDEGVYQENNQVDGNTTTTTAETTTENKSKLSDRTKMILMGVGGFIVTGIAIGAGVRWYMKPKNKNIK
tara:strand:- start:326 stop:5428 length:5103 start_codon:yes stop_codon:yes gene_type:complete